MRRRGAPLFLAKSGYRRRRLNDAARLVPVFGAFLIFLPILWGPARTPEPDTAADGLYLFGVWAGLIAAAAALAPGLRRNSGPEADAKPDPVAADRG